MLTENTLKKFIIAEGLHLPHGTKSAKIVTHVDLDGAVSGITLINQLVKQGIPKERISVEFAQYGDEKSADYEDRFKGRKGEFVAVSDYAKLPQSKIWDVFFKLTSFKGSESALLKLLQVKYNTQKDLEAAVEKMYNIQRTKWTDGNYKELFKAINAYQNLKQLHVHNKKVPFTEATIQNIKELKIPLVTPDFVSDHHDNDKGNLFGGKQGEIGYTVSPSDAEHISKKFAPGLWSRKDLEAVSMVDSAKYSEELLKNTVFLEKKFKGEDRTKNLAIICACVYDGLCKKDRTAAAWVLKNSSTSLISLYNNAIKAIGYNGKRLEYVSALKNGEMEKAKELLAGIPEWLNKKYARKGEPTAPVLSAEGWQKKNATDIEKMKTGYKNRQDDKRLEELKGKRSEEARTERELIKSKKGKVFAHNNFAIFNGNDKKQQYTRYATTLYSENGYRMPFSMRYWDGFFQISKSSFYKETVDFRKVFEHVLVDIKAFLVKEGITNADKIIAVMEEKSGGHANGIWNFSGFDEIKPGYGKTEWPEKERDKYYKAKKFVDKLDVAKKIVDRIDAPDSIVSKYKDIKKRCIEAAMNSAVSWTNKLFPVSQESLEKLKTKDTDFEVTKTSIK